MKDINARQQKIFRYIRKNSPVSNRQIRDYLAISSDEIVRITVVRDIEKLIEKELVIKVGKGRGVVYEISKKNSCFLELDVDDYFMEEADSRILISDSFNFEIFDYISPDFLTKEESEEIEKHNDGYSRRLKDFSSPALKKEIERLTIELSWKSSVIEGNTYSLLDTETLIRDHVEAKGHGKEEAIMILNHKKAIDYIFNNKKVFVDLSVSKIEDLHSLVVGDLNIERNIRKRLVGITGTKYRPIDNEFQIREGLQKVCSFANNKKIHPFLKAMMAVLLLSYIQPFEDGNKRTARLIGNAILLVNNYCPLSYRSVDVTEYKKATLLFYEQNNITYFKQLFMEQFRFAVNNYFG